MSHPLEDHHRQIAAGIAEIRDHCSRAAPDMAALGAARLRLSRASSARSRHIHDILIPACRERADEATRAALDDMQRQFAAKRLASSEHVATWSSKAVADDWPGYRLAAQRICSMMEEQMDRERRLFG